MRLTSHLGSEDAYICGLVARLMQMARVAMVEEDGSSLCAKNG